MYQYSLPEVMSKTIVYVGIPTGSSGRLVHCCTEQLPHRALLLAVISLQSLNLQSIVGWPSRRTIKRNKTMSDDDDSSITAEELIDALNEGIVRCIQTAGKVLPSSTIQRSFSPVQCEWTEFSTDLCSPAVEDLRQYFPPLDGSEVGTDGRPLLYAACLGLLLSERRDDNKVEGVSSDSKTPLSTFLSIASFLLDEFEVDPNQQTETEGACHRPPLHLVARSCHPSAVHALLSRDADPNLRDEEGWTALMACSLPDIPSVEDGGPTTEERVNTMKALLENDDSSIDARNWCGYTALLHCCEGLNSALIEYLLNRGADATLRSVWGHSCLGIIKTQSYIDVEKAAKCEAIIASHLERTGQMKAIQSFLEEEGKAIDLLNLVDDVLIPASQQPHSDNGSGGLASQDCRIINALMKHLEMDPGALFQSNTFAGFSHEEGNLYATIHSRIMELVPLAYMKVYKSTPTDDEREIITCTNYDIRKKAQTSLDGVRRIDSSIIMGECFHLHRERGHIAQQLEILTDLIVGPLQRTLAFGIPSNAVLKQVIEQAPRIVEMGAGTGYWSCMLSMIGADVVAYDAQPPLALGSKDDPDGMNKNEFVGPKSYFPVQEGDASTVFDGSNPELYDRALLLVWPNNPDAQDNAHVTVGGSILPEIWDLDCLQRYHEMGGSTVIYVGEREAKIELMPDATDADCGFCASRKFQQFLQEHYELEAELECPRWWMKEDDVTIWKRK